MPDRSIWEGAPPDLDARIRTTRLLLALADGWDVLAAAEDTDAPYAIALWRASGELREVIRRL